MYGRFRCGNLLMLLFVLTAFSGSAAYPQDIPDTAAQTSETMYVSDDSTTIEQTNINWTRLGIVGGSLIAADIAVWMYYKEAWYQEERTVWHVWDDWYNYKLNVDKWSHLHTTMAQSRLSYHLMRYSGFADPEALWIGAAIGWLLELQIELNDAYFADWGFSWSDLGANTLGALFPVMQYYVPFLNNFDFKFSYHVSPNYNKGYVEHAIEDYEGMTFWLTVKPNDMLPASVEKYYPDWLNFAVGYSGEEMFSPRGKPNSDGFYKGRGSQQWYLALDVDLLKIFKPERDTFWYSLLHILDLFHLPMPAVRLTPGSVYYGLYF